MSSYQRRVYLPNEDLVVRGVYELYSRNIFWGVYDGTGFIGLRHKFEWRLDKEFVGHTVQGAMRYFCQLPDEIELNEYLTGPAGARQFLENGRLLGYLLRLQQEEGERH